MPDFLIIISKLLHSHCYSTVCLMGISRSWCWEGSEGLKVKVKQAEPEGCILMFLFGMNYFTMWACLLRLCAGAVHVCSSGADPVSWAGGGRPQAAAVDRDPTLPVRLRTPSVITEELRGCFGPSIRVIVPRLWYIHHNFLGFFPVIRCMCVRQLRGGEGEQEEAGPSTVQTLQTYRRLPAAPWGLQRLRRKYDAHRYLHTSTHLRYKGNTGDTHTHWNANTAAICGLDIQITSRHTLNKHPHLRFGLLTSAQKDQPNSSAFSVQQMTCRWGYMGDCSHLMVIFLHVFSLLQGLHPGSLVCHHPEPPVLPGRRDSGSG